jgi:hypothetical protein
MLTVPPEPALRWLAAFSACLCLAVRDWRNDGAPRQAHCVGRGRPRGRCLGISVHDIDRMHVSALERALGDRHRV